MKKWLKSHAKAVGGAATAGITAAGGAVVLALSDGTITGAEWSGIAIAGVTAAAASLGIVWRVPNKTTED